MIQEIYWDIVSDGTGSDPFELSFTDTAHPDLTFKVVGVDGGGSVPHTYMVEVARIGDDAGNGSVIRQASAGFLSQQQDLSLPIKDSLDTNTLRRIEHWVREQRELLTSVVPEGITKYPYSAAYGK